LVDAQVIRAWAKRVLSVKWLFLNYASTIKRNKKQSMLDAWLMPAAESWTLRYMM